MYDTVHIILPTIIILEATCGGLEVHGNLGKPRKKPAYISISSRLWALLAANPIHIHHQDPKILPSPPSNTLSLMMATLNF